MNLESKVTLVIALWIAKNPPALWYYRYRVESHTRLFKKSLPKCLMKDSEYYVTIAYMFS